MSKRKGQAWTAENMPWIAASAAASERIYLERTEPALGGHYTRTLARGYVDALDHCAL